MASAATQLPQPPNFYQDNDPGTCPYGSLWVSTAGELKVRTALGWITVGSGAVSDLAYDGTDGFQKQPDGSMKLFVGGVEVNHWT